MFKFVFKDLILKIESQTWESQLLHLLKYLFILNESTIISTEPMSCVNPGFW